MDWKIYLLCVHMVMCITLHIVHAQTHDVRKTDICSTTDINMQTLSDIGRTGTIYLNKTNFALSLSEAAGEVHDLGGDKCIIRFELCQECRVRIYSQSGVFTHDKACDFHIQAEIRSMRSREICDSRCSYLYAVDNVYGKALAFLFDPTHIHDFASVSRRAVMYMCLKRGFSEPPSFTLNYTIERKETIYSSAAPLIESEQFPQLYPRQGDIYKYAIKRQNYEAIRLVFDDYDIARVSQFAFENANVLKFDGFSYRPNVIWYGRHASYANFTFLAGKEYDQTVQGRMGFRATFTFHRGTLEEHDFKTDCGFYDLNTYGGLIDYKHSARSQEVDCVWVIGTKQSLDKIFIRLVDFKATDRMSSFEIRSGLTSSSYEMKTYNAYTNDRGATFHDRVGFYIRLRGRMEPGDRLEIVYASYYLLTGSGTCTANFLLCDDRCLDSSLVCDSTHTEHCSAGEDEQNCFSGGSDSDSGFSSINIVVPVIVAVFLIIVITLFVFFVWRCRKLSQRGVPREDIRSVAGNLSRRGRSRRGQIRVTVHEEYDDAPPSYDEVLRSPPTDIGYFNLAFMWSQPDAGHTGLISPPSYTDAVSTAQQPSTDPPNRVGMVQQILGARPEMAEQNRAQGRSITDGTATASSRAEVPLSVRRQKQREKHSSSPEVYVGSQRPKPHDQDKTQDPLASTADDDDSQSDQLQEVRLRVLELPADTVVTANVTLNTRNPLSRNGSQSTPLCDVSQLQHLSGESRCSGNAAGNARPVQYQPTIDPAPRLPILTANLIRPSHSVMDVRENRRSPSEVSPAVMATLR